jgi:hypothetical protein
VKRVWITRGLFVRGYTTGGAYHANRWCCARGGAHVSLNGVAAVRAGLRPCRWCHPATADTLTPPLLPPEAAGEGVNAESPGR